MNKRDKQKLQKEAQRIDLQGNDLYKALHFVGDDPVKAEVDDVLKEVLPEEHYRTVVAVFNLSTGWKEL
jgi:hypothetical protein